MANQSNAKGLITLRGDSMETLADLFQSISYFRDYEHGICLLFPFDEQYVFHGRNKTCPYEISGKFTGTGRASFDANIKNMGRELAYEFRSDPKERQKLESADFQITYEFADEESGCGLLYEAGIRSTHRKGRALDEMTAATYYQYSYDYTAENLVATGFYESAFQLQPKYMKGLVEKFSHYKEIIGTDYLKRCEKEEFCRSLCDFLIENGTTDIFLNGVNPLEIQTEYPDEIGDLLVQYYEKII